jgi:hypothetical protein
MPLVAVLSTQQRPSDHAGANDGLLGVVVGEDNHVVSTE